MSDAILEIRGVSKRFGGIHAVRDVSFDVAEGETVGVIGPNGAGKSTLLELIAGAQRADRGSIKFRGRELVGKSPNWISRHGVVRTFQKLRPFLGMTALENVTVSALVHERNRAAAIDTARECLSFVGLDHKEHALASTLSTGQRKRLELARAIASKPDVYLLDEVTAGIDHRALPELVALIARLRERGGTIVLIEHNLPVLSELCGRLVAMNLGEKIAEGDPNTVLDDPQVITAYVGADE